MENSGNALLALIAVIGLFLVIIYNNLVRKRNRCENAFAGIDVQLKKRYDLIPNLVSTVKGYAQHERETLDAVMEARAKALQGGSTNQRVDNENMVGAALSRLLMLQESYPNLKANTQFTMLQRSLNEVEEQLSASRRTFNAAVNDYNDACESFPSNLVAGSFGFSRRSSFEINDAERQPVQVTF